MNNKRKIMHGFISILHCCLLAIPLLVVLYNCLRYGLSSGFSSTTQYVYDASGNFLTSAHEFSLADTLFNGFYQSLNDFDVVHTQFLSTDANTWGDWYTNYVNQFPFLMSTDFLSLFSLGGSIDGNGVVYYMFINYYFNWLINMSVIAFIPEIIVIFIDMCRKLVYTFTHKIHGGW